MTMTPMDGLFGRWLVNGGLVAEDDLREARELQRHHPFLHIGEILVEMGAISFPALVEALSDYRRHGELGRRLVEAGAISCQLLAESLFRQAATGILLGKVLLDMEACPPEVLVCTLAAIREEASPRALRPQVAA